MEVGVYPVGTSVDVIDQGRHLGLPRNSEDEWGGSVEDGANIQPFWRGITQYITRTGLRFGMRLCTP